MGEVMKLIKKDLKHFYYTRIKHLTDREIQQNYLRSLGMKIGNECYIFSDKIDPNCNNKLSIFCVRGSSI